MLQMADKSKNEQYDIVMQAEKVLADYIKRYFSLGYIKKEEKKKKHKKMLTTFAVSAICGVVVFAYIFSYFM